MAARRLIAVMLVLLFLSSLAAALAPVEPEDERTSTSTAAEPPAPRAPRGGGGLVRATIEPGKPATRRVEASVGDQLQLAVHARRVMAVELAGLGLTDDAAPGVPARFDLLLADEGEIRVRPLGGGQRLGVIVVAARAESEGPDAAGDDADEN